jgi:dynein intermediate chain 3, axonemal
MVNATVQYDPKDFISEMQKISQSDQGITEKLDKFILRVSGRVEEALQSNELINVFQDDFEMLGSEEAAASSKINTVNILPRQFAEHDYCKNKRVSCVKFHPT